MTSEIEATARRARKAALELSALGTDAKNQALKAVRDALLRRRDEILRANRADKDEALLLVEAGKLSRPLFKRLDLEGEKLDSVLAGIDDVRRLPDPVGRVDYAMRLDEGLDLYRVSCPIGVLGVIFEARPDAAVQISTLGLKSANAVILKGGREAERTHRALVEAMREGIAAVKGVPQDAIQLISTREDARAMLALDRWIDLVIPRGSNELVRSIQAATRIPVLGHADGLCGVYIDRKANLDKAVKVVLDSKTQYPAVCNAAETLLLHREILPDLWPPLGEKLLAAHVELRADPEARSFFPAAKPASEEDFRTEFLDLILAVKTVGSVAEAVDHINAHGSHHTDAIVTEDPMAAEYFLSRVDSAGVFQNASTRFADGFRYGLGAEVGVSTQKTHARGPVGLEGLVIYKYRLYGEGQGVGDYGPGKREFLHRPIEGKLDEERPSLAPPHNH
jgi:glutamate-5-semialdehyde dehydrogenase